MSRLFWNLGIGIGILNFFRYLDRIFWRHPLRGVLKFLQVTYLPLWSKSLKNTCKGVNYSVGAAHRPVIIQLRCLSSVWQFLLFSSYFQEQLFVTFPVTASDLYLYPLIYISDLYLFRLGIFFKIAFLSLRQEWKLFLLK